MLAKNARETTIDGKAYQILLAPPTKCMGLATRVTFLLGRIIPTLTADMKKGGWESFATALADTDPEKVEALFMDAVRIGRLHFENNPIFDKDFDKHFNDHRGDLFQVCAWALWESVRDFLPQGIATAIQKKGSDLTTEFKSQKDGSKNTG